MAALKYIGTMMMLSGHGQVRVAAKTTYADFSAMTGISRDYLSETGKDVEIAWLDALPEQTIYIFGNRPRADVRPEAVPETHIRYKSAKDKKATLAAQAFEIEERKAARAEERLARAAARTAEGETRVARKLYDFGQHNEPWEDAMKSVRDTYLSRAREVIAVLHQP